MICRFCAAGRLESGDFNCETVLHGDGTWVRGWLCMYRTRRTDSDFSRHVSANSGAYTRPVYSAAPQLAMDLK